VAASCCEGEFSALGQEKSGEKLGYLIFKGWVTLIAPKGDAEGVWYRRCLRGMHVRVRHQSEPGLQRWMMLRRLRLVPFFQEYWPIPGTPARLPAKFFDMDLNEVICLTFRSNGQNWEKYLRWLNRLYFDTYGKYYLSLLKVIYRYNHRECIRPYLQQPEALTTELYCSYQQVNPFGCAQPLSQ
jgi:hypothetical protein